MLPTASCMEGVDGIRACCRFCNGSAMLRCSSLSLVIPNPCCIISTVSREYYDDVGCMVMCAQAAVDVVGGFVELLQRQRRFTDVFQV